MVEHVVDAGVDATVEFVSGAHEQDVEGVERAWRGVALSKGGKGHTRLSDYFKGTADATGIVFVDMVVVFGIFCFQFFQQVSDPVLCKVV